MAKQSIIYFDGGEITKTRLSYKVTLDAENCTIFIPIDHVEEIQNICNEDEYLISALLGYIEYIRRSTITSEDYINKPNISTLTKCFHSLLANYPIETLINVFYNLKWHEISKILHSNNPSEEISEFV